MLKAYIYILLNWGVTITDSQLNHPYYIDDVPHAVYIAELCNEPFTAPTKDHVPTVGDTVYLNRIHPETSEIITGDWVKIISVEN